MTVEELIEALSSLPPEEVVGAWVGDDECHLLCVSHNPEADEERFRVLIHVDT